MSSVCDRLLEVLFPGSSHPTRFSALNILGTIAEIFSVPEGERTNLMAAGMGDTEEKSLSQIENFCQSKIVFIVLYFCISCIAFILREGRILMVFLEKGIVK